MFNFANDTRKSKRLVKALQEVAIAKESKRFERQGLRRVPIKAIGENELKAISKWIDGLRGGPPADGGTRVDPLLLTAIELADERYTSKEKYEATVRRLTAEVERGTKLGTFVTSEKQTHFDPRVALEILKLCYATGRGWSFVVHLLLLYGINAFVESLAIEGLSPPAVLSQIPDPADLIAHAGESARAHLLEGK